MRVVHHRAVPQPSLLWLLVLVLAQSEGNATPMLASAVCTPYIILLALIKDATF